MGGQGSKVGPNAGQSLERAELELRRAEEKLARAKEAEAERVLASPKKAPKTPAATPKTPAGPRAAADDGDAITALRTAYGEDGGGDDGSLLGGGRQQSAALNEMMAGCKSKALREVLQQVMSNDDAVTALQLDGVNRRQHDDDDVHLLVAAMAAWPNTAVTSISLGGNALTAGGASSLASGLRRSHTLMSLRLGGNRIGDRGAEALADALRANRTLGTLDLRLNLIDERELQTLLQGGC